MLVETRKNVVIVPYRKAWIGGPDIAAIPEHGRITRAGIPADEFRPIRTEPAPLAGHWLYGGPLKVHFSHVIMDSIIRLWAFDPARHDGVLFPYLPQPPKDIPEWFLEIAALFGVERHQVRVIRSPIAAESVDFAEPGERPRENPSGWYLRFLDALPLRHESETPRHVYLGRVERTFLGAGPQSIEAQLSGNNEAGFFLDAIGSVRRHNDAASRCRARAFFLLLAALASFILAISLLPLHKQPGMAVSGLALQHPYS